ncbi:MAG: hypothetical protein WKF81_14525, partial [Thermomicrobiales bacterium]
PVVLRERSALAETSGRGLSVFGDEDHLIHTKPADFGSGTIVRLQNLGPAEADVVLRNERMPILSATLTSFDERDQGTIDVNAGDVSVRVPARAIQSVRLL